MKRKEEAPSNKIPAKNKRRLTKKTRHHDADDDNDSVQIVHGPTQPIAERQSEWFGIRLDMWKKMKQYSLPFAVFNLMWWYARNGTDDSRVERIDYIEWFNGVQ